MKKLDETALAIMVTSGVLLSIRVCGEILKTKKARVEKKEIEGLAHIKDSLQNTVEYKEAVEKFNQLSDQQKLLLQKQSKEEFVR